jgi:single-stranded DNA-binding protein
MNSWRAGCVETRTSGSEGGLRKRTGRKTGTAPQPDPYVWRDQAENVAESVAKGNRVIVNGRLKSRAWETPDGDKRSIVEIDADEVGPSLKWATARPERTSSAASKSGQFNDEPPF